MFDKTIFLEFFVFGQVLMTQKITKFYYSLFNNKYVVEILIAYKFEVVNRFKFGFKDFVKVDTILLSSCLSKSEKSSFKG